MDTPTKKNNKTNYLYAIASVTAVLFLLGFFLLLFSNSKSIMSSLKEKILFIAELKPGYEDSYQNTQKEIEAYPFVKGNISTFVSKEEIRDEMKDVMGEDLEEESNPFYDNVEFYVKKEYISKDSLESIREQLILLEEVQDIYYQDSLSTNISKNINNVLLVMVFLTVTLLVISIFLIFNTIKLSLYANRFLIKNMQLVGASPNFILMPFLQKNILYGMLSSVIAFVLLLFINQLLLQAVPDLANYQSTAIFVVLFVILLLLGASLMGVSTWFTVRRYLATSSQQLH